MRRNQLQGHTTTVHSSGHAAQLSRTGMSAGNTIRFLWCCEFFSSPQRTSRRHPHPPTQFHRKSSFNAQPGTDRRLVRRPHGYVSRRLRLGVKRLNVLVSVSRFVGWLTKAHAKDSCAFQSLAGASGYRCCSGKRDMRIRKMYFPGQSTERTAVQNPGFRELTRQPPRLSTAGFKFPACQNLNR